MDYDTVQYYNVALALFAGVGVATVAFRLLPLPSPEFRTRCLLASALRDLRRLAIAPLPPPSEEWDGRMNGQLAALPDQAEPSQRSRLIAALSVGNAIIELRHMAPHLGAAAELDAALAAFARGKSAIAIAQLRQLDYRLAGSDTAQETAMALRARGRLMVISEGLAEHRSYFDAGESV
jgi:Fusaric acid resistance protein family